MGGEHRPIKAAKSICPFCSVGCGVRYNETTRNGRGWNAAVNTRGELCPKGVAAYDIVTHEDRLTEPLVREDGQLVTTSWEKAFDRIEAAFTDIVHDHGADALAFFASSGCTNEENYLLQKVARLVGTNNVDNCTRLCHSSTVTAMKERFGVGAMTNTQQFSSSGCSCCGQYASYLRESLDTTLTETETEDVTALKHRHDIPTELQSCHTLVLDEYVVEGHAPAEVIATMLDEEPAIDGIALPGMPAGSPRMGGTKSGSFTVYTLGGGKTGEVYAEI